MTEIETYAHAVHRHATQYWWQAIVALLCLGVLTTWFCAKLRALSERRRLSARHTVIAEYESPKQLSAAELGYIIDAAFGNNELLATIVQLYGKGVVQLHLLGNDNFMITPNAEDKGTVDDAEASVLGYLRSLPSGGADWKQLKSAVSDVAGQQADFEDAVLGSLVEKGFLYPGSLAGQLFRKRIVSVLVATFGTFAAGLPIYLWGQTQVSESGMAAAFVGIDKGVGVLLYLPVLALIWLLGLAYINLLTLIYTQRNGTPTGATEQLRKLWPDVAGYRLFLQETEFVRLQHDPDMHDPAFAYCLALGLGLDITRNLKK